MPCPLKYFSEEALLDAGLGADDANVLGPRREFQANLIEEDEDGSEVYAGIVEKFLILDATDGILANLREYDPETDPSANIAPYSELNPVAIVNKIAEVAPQVLQWIQDLSSAPRLTFYSA